ncbi:MDS3 [Candida jiufengensis]|uniref:MDS3 n=1 Tax=Candida jiufengensis TaxID=497108 RepID=UPI0022249BF0|nr:MDS3 [Candida jiufengensis]KAI5952792.1 MDS3 [Candida jiufengensis]
MKDKVHQFSISETSSIHSRPLSKQPTRNASVPIHTTISFDDYVHYAAPKSSNIKSLYPPAAVTLGRNAFDRYGDQVSDFEVISCNGDRIPVSMAVLLKRWGKYFALILARSYVLAAENFEAGLSNNLKGDWTKLTNDSSEDLNKKSYGEVPHFRIPFQESKESLDKPTTNKTEKKITQPQINELPPQPPVPTEPIPAVPSQTTFKNTSRAGSQDHNSPRSSLMHTLSVLRNIPTTGKSPRESPFSSPRASYSGQGSVSNELRSSPFPNLRPNFGSASSDLKLSSIDSGVGSSEMSDSTRHPSEIDVDDEEDEEEGAHEEEEEIESDTESDILDYEKKTYPMEPALVPRKLYLPFSTNSVKAFCEFFYTGQIGSKWSLAPTLLDNFMISKFYKIPLLYDSILEILITILKRKEDQILSNLSSEQRLEYEEFIYFINKGQIKKEDLQKYSDLNIVEDREFDENDQEQINLAYQESEDLSAPNVGPRVRSIFDRSSIINKALQDDENEDRRSKLNFITVEELVDPNSINSINDIVIEAILDAAILVNELKLVIRINKLYNLVKS